MHEKINAALRIDHRPFKEFWTDSRDDVDVLSSPLHAGAVHLESDGKLLYDGQLRPGMLRLRAPGERLYMRVLDPCKHLFVTIPGNEFRRMFEPLSEDHHHGTVAFMEPLVTADKRVHSLCLAMLSAFTMPSAVRQLFVDGLTRSLLGLLVMSNGQVGKIVQQPRGGLSAPQLNQSMEYADANQSSPLALNTWASIIDMSASEFGRRFLRSTGKSPYAWLVERRIDHSKLLLANPTLTLSEVSLLAGFCSQSHYSSAFRRYIGGSPGRWRRELRTTSP